MSQRTSHHFADFLHRSVRSVSSHASGLMGGPNHETTVDTPSSKRAVGTRAAVEALTPNFSLPPFAFDYHEPRVEASFHKPTVSATERVGIQSCEGECEGVHWLGPAPTVQSVWVAMSRNPMQPSLGMSMKRRDQILLPANAAASGLLSRLRPSGIAMSWPCTRMAVSVCLYSSLQRCVGGSRSCRVSRRSIRLLGLSPAAGPVLATRGARRPWPAPSS